MPLLPGAYSHHSRLVDPLPLQRRNPAHTLQLSLQKRLSLSQALVRQEQTPGAAVPRLRLEAPCSLPRPPHQAVLQALVHFELSSPCQRLALVFPGDNESLGWSDPPLLRATSTCRSLRTALDPLCGLGPGPQVRELGERALSSASARCCWDRSRWASAAHAQLRLQGPASRWRQWWGVGSMAPRT